MTTLPFVHLGLRAAAATLAFAIAIASLVAPGHAGAKSLSRIDDRSLLAVMTGESPSVTFVEPKWSVKPDKSRLERALLADRTREFASTIICKVDDVALTGCQVAELNPDRPELAAALLRSASRARLDRGFLTRLAGHVEEVEITLFRADHSAGDAHPCVASLCTPIPAPPPPPGK